MLSQYKQKKAESRIHFCALYTVPYALSCPNHIKFVPLWLSIQSIVFIYKAYSSPLRIRSPITRYYIQNSVDNRPCPVISRTKGGWSVEP